MVKQFHLLLDELDIGQALDGLRGRQEAWANTAVFLRDGSFPGEPFLCEECSSEDEALKIAGHYRRIIDQIEGQLAAQGGL
ncbi:MAG: hypothetical protein H0X40_09895 [Chthoniobacterales bacterium]|nr:hypothetical protein [Chthoniobacterales bacterium]